MTGTVRYEAKCDHCDMGVMSRDSLIFTGKERLCPRCSAAREAAEARARAFSGWLLLGGSTLGGVGGFFAGQYVGIFVGIIVGLILAGVVEGRLKKY